MVGKGAESAEETTCSEGTPEALFSRWRQKGFAEKRRVVQCCLCRRRSTRTFNVEKEADEERSVDEKRMSRGI